MPSAVSLFCLSVLYSIYIGGPVQAHGLQMPKAAAGDTQSPYNILPPRCLQEQCRCKILCHPFHVLCLWSYPTRGCYRCCFLSRGRIKSSRYHPIHAWGDQVRGEYIPLGSRMRGRSLTFRCGTARPSWAPALRNEGSSFVNEIRVTAKMAASFRSSVSVDVIRKQCRSWTVHCRKINQSVVSNMDFCKFFYSDSKLQLTALTSSGTSRKSATRFKKKCEHNLTNKQF